MCEKTLILRAEGVGFEPTRSVNPFRFSRPVPSATRRALQWIVFHEGNLEHELVLTLRSNISLLMRIMFLICVSFNTNLIRNSPFLFLVNIYLNDIFIRDVHALNRKHIADKLFSFRSV
jgi:hypothetical protein